MRNRTVAARETKLNVPGLRHSTETSASICKGPMVYKRVRGCDLRNWRRVWFSVCISNGKNLNILYFFTCCVFLFGEHFLCFTSWLLRFIDTFYIRYIFHQFLVQRIHFIPVLVGFIESFLYISTAAFHIYFFLLLQ